MKEANFQKEIRESVENLWGEDALYIKIPDAMRGGNSRFIPKKPFDIIILHKHHHDICIEAKMIKRYKTNRKIKGGPSLSLSKDDRIRYKEQADHLIRCEEIGKLSCFLVNIRGIFPKINKGKKINLSVILTPEQMIQEMKDNKGSIPASLLLDKYPHITRTRGYWGLDFLEVILRTQNKEKKLCKGTQNSTSHQSSSGKVTTLEPTISSQDCSKTESLSSPSK